MTLYLLTKFQVSSINLASFRQGNSFTTLYNKSLKIPPRIGFNTHYVCYRLGKSTREMLFSIDEGTAASIVDVVAKVCNGFWHSNLIPVDLNGPRIKNSDETWGKNTLLCYLP